jgi:hypothetical protein
MSVQDRRARTKVPHRVDTVAAWFDAARPSFSQQDLVSALEGMTRVATGAELPARDREFWDRNSGISARPRDVARASAANAAARMLMDSSALTASEVAERMHLTASTIRHYKAARKLYSYLVNGKLVFPDWQFNDAGDKSIPSLEDVLDAIPEDLHPQSVAGFFLTPQPDLILHGNLVSAKAWLEAGGPARNVIDLAEGLAAGY